MRTSRASPRRARPACTWASRSCPFAIGAWIGGQASGFLVAKYLPKEGARDPFAIWSIYAGLGLVCAFAMFVYGQLTRGQMTKGRTAEAILPVERSDEV